MFRVDFIGVRLGICMTLFLYFLSPNRSAVLPMTTNLWFYCLFGTGSFQGIEPMTSRSEIRDTNLCALEEPLFFSYTLF